MWGFILTFALVLLMVPYAYGGDVGIMGMTLGKSLRECKISECKIQKLDGYRKEYFDKQDNLCWKDQFDDYTRSKRIDKAARIYTFDYLSFHTESIVAINKKVGKLEDEKITRIVVWLHPDDAGRMLQLLKDKFGNPQFYDTSVVQNKMGAKFDRFIAVWDVEGHSISLDSRLSIDKSRLMAIHKDIAIPETENYIKKKSQDKDKI